MTILLALIAMIQIASKKKYRFLPATILIFVYSVLHDLRSLSTLTGTALFDVLSVAELPLLIVTFIVIVWTFKNPLKNGRAYLLTIIFAVGIVVNKIIRMVFFRVQTQHIAGLYADMMPMFEALEFWMMLLDILYFVLFLGMIISILFILNQPNTESPS